VKTVNVTEEAAKWLNAGNRILYKSDTEGFDEWIATLIPMAVWEKTFSGLMELWRIPGKPNLDIAAFTAILDGFSNKVFLGNPDMQTKEERCNTADVLDYIAAQADENHRDLAFWR
jgi:hypothetical protein